MPFLRRKFEFKKWSISNYKKITVAHIAAKTGCLPKNFSNWDLSDINGCTVAHIAARNKNLPRNFNQWNLSKNNGISVDVYYEKFNYSIGLFDDVDIITEGQFNTNVSDNVYLNEIVFSVNKVTLCNDNGISRQDIISRLDIGIKLVVRKMGSVNKNGEFGVFTLEDEQIGQVPKETAIHIQPLISDRNEVPATVYALYGGHRSYYYGLKIKIMKN